MCFVSDVLNIVYDVLVLYELWCVFVSDVLNIVFDVLMLYRLWCVLSLVY